MQKISTHRLWFSLRQCKEKVLPEVEVYLQKANCLTASKLYIFSLTVCCEAVVSDAMFACLSEAYDSQVKTILQILISTGVSKTWTLHSKHAKLFSHSSILSHEALFTVPPFKTRI